MPDTTSPAKARREAQDEAKQQRADDNDGRFTSSDTFENPDKKALTTVATVEDANGIERIVAPAATDWTPAPLEATDEQKKAASEREGQLKEAREQRLAQLKSVGETDGSGNLKKGSSKVDKDDPARTQDGRAANNAGDGGSQTTTA